MHDQIPIDGAVLNYYRKQLDLSVRAFAYKLKINPGNLSRMEKNQLKVSVKTKLRLSELMGVTYAQLKIDYLLRHKNKSKNEKSGDL